MNHEAQVDAAWVTVSTSLEAADLRTFCRDVERLFRINPLLEFEDWHEVHPGRYRMRGRNLGNGMDLDLSFAAEERDDGIEVRYEGGLKRTTRFRVEPAPEGARLVVTEDYGGLSEAERRARVDEVDNSLVPWGNALWRYLRLWRRWSWFAPWRWYMARVWQPMKPSARRIVSLIVLITAAEFVGFLFVFSVFWLELDRFF